MSVCQPGYFYAYCSVEMARQQDNLNKLNFESSNLPERTKVLAIEEVARPTPAPTKKPVPVPTAVPPTTSPPVDEPVQAPAGSSLNPGIIFNLINQHRQNIGLPAYLEHADLCALAQSRAPELYREIFVTRNLHGGLYARNLPYYVTENMIHQPSEQAAFNWWMRSSLHRRAIESSQHIYSCGACEGNSCAQLFTSFQPK